MAIRSRKIVSFTNLTGHGVGAIRDYAGHIAFALSIDTGVDWYTLKNLIFFQKDVLETCLQQACNSLLSFTCINKGLHTPLN
jgi:hypothetical protein